MSVWQVLFAAAAFFNFAIATAMFAAADRIAMHLSLTGPGAPYVVGALGFLIAAFGVGYAIVARAPSRHRAIVIIGLISKVGVALMGAMQFAADLIPYRYLVLGMSDLVFAALFAWFLWRRRHLPQPT